MSPFHHAARWVGAAAVGLLVAAGASLPASATSTPLTLASSSPAEDQVLTAPPSSVRLQFAQQLDGRDVTIAVACNGSPANTGEAAPDPDGRSVLASLSGTQPGVCTVSYQVPSASGAPISDSYEFTIQEQAESTPSTVASDDSAADTAAPSSTKTTTPTTTTATATADESGSGVGGPLGLARLFSFLGVLALFGGLVLIALHWNEGVEYLVTLRYLRIIWVIGAVATVFVVIFSTAQLPGNSVGGAISPTSWTDLFDTTVGKALIARLLLVLLSGWVAWQPDRVTDPATQLAGIAVPGLAVVTLGFSRSGGDGELLGYLGGIVQALGASVWLGGLLLLTRAVLVGPGEEDLVHAVRGFSRLAPLAIIATVVGGIIQVWRLDGMALLTTGHGRLSILSGLAIAAAIYLGTATRQFAAQRLAHADHLDGRLAHRLRRAFTIESLIGLAALLLTAWMLALTPPKTVRADDFRDTTEYAFTSPTSDGAFSVRLQVTATEVGPFGFRLEVFKPASGLSDLQVKFVPPPEAYETTPAIVAVIPLDGVGAAVMADDQGIGFAVPGEWTAEISATLAGQTAPTTLRVSGLTITDAGTSTGGGSSTDSTGPTDTSTDSTAAPSTDATSTSDTVATTDTAAAGTATSAP